MCIRDRVYTCFKGLKRNRSPNAQMSEDSSQNWSEKTGWLMIQSSNVISQSPIQASLGRGIDTLGDKLTSSSCCAVPSSFVRLTMRLQSLMRLSSQATFYS